MNDLLDDKVITRGKHYIAPRGYIGMPGRGPNGETCGTCKHHVVISRAKRYHKCGLTNFTSGAVTDIRVKSPACERWEDESSNPLDGARLRKGD